MFGSLIDFQTSPEAFFRAFRSFTSPDDFIFQRPTPTYPRPHSMVRQRGSPIPVQLVRTSKPVVERTQEDFGTRISFSPRPTPPSPPRSPSPPPPRSRNLSPPRSPAPSPESSPPSSPRSSPSSPRSSSTPVQPESPLTPSQILKKRLNLYGMKEKTEISGDGNCQFSAVADQLCDNPGAHAQIRKLAVKWLRANPHYTLPNRTVLKDYLQTEFFPSWNDYCDYMQQTGTWGDHYTLIAVSEVFNVKIVILTSMDVDPSVDPFTVIVPKRWKTEGTGKTIYLSHLHELHYGSVTSSNDA